MAERWSTEQIPDQRGRLAVVTGANSGLGMATARELARAGADVVLACRDVAKAEAAAADIRNAVAGARLTVEALDLAELASVRAFHERFAAAHERLDLLVCNAGIMAPPRRLTADGFESQLGTNHLGHFALCGLLLGQLIAAPAARVVVVSSGAHRIGKIRFDDLQGERRYRRWLAYGQSKLANLLFCFELQRRATAAELPLLAVAAHPGYASTNLQTANAGRIGQWPAKLANALFAQSADAGALPSLFAATQSDIPGGSFVGPDGFQEVRGRPTFVTPTGAARDPEAARRLWEVSEELTGVRFAL